jgi:type II secretory pathway component GspD/PulD (secretin)
MNEGERKMKLVNGIFAIALTIILSGPAARAQTSSPKPASDTSAAKPASDLEVRTFSLNNASQPNDANEIYTLLRNMLPSSVKSYFLPSQMMITVRATPEDLALVQKLLNDVDRPKKTYRLTYTITEMEGGKRVGTQHFAMVVASGQPTKLKQGSKVPVVTGSYSPSGASTSGPGVQTQFTYLDVGMNFEATLDEFANGVRLRSNVEQLSIAEEKSGVGAQDPIVRQTSLTGASFLSPGKPLVLGSLDIPGSTRHLDIEVVMEQLR